MVYPGVAGVCSALQYPVKVRYACTVSCKPATNTFIPSQPDSKLRRCDQRACLGANDRTRCAEAQQEEGRRWSRCDPRLLYLQPLSDECSLACDIENQRQ